MLEISMLYRLMLSQSSFHSWLCPNCTNLKTMNSAKLEFLLLWLLTHTSQLDTKNHQMILNSTTLNFSLKRAGLQMLSTKLIKLVFKFLQLQLFSLKFSSQLLEPLTDKNSKDCSLLSTLQDLPHTSPRLWRVLICSNPTWFALFSP